ncbi:hypothetical protein [Paracoccus sp. DMF]|uniref:hypothetical protein n=1 Tax=Paracoccus sp. DMF TaxID=400837 RepID=UPI0021E4D7CE|nr:hypothetical protein [Paracoccus sp. DMF]MCV2447978.1 hypothetical protein [Paracoccus sp. DMF]
MEIVWLIAAATVALTAGIRALRAAARSWRGLALELGLLLGAAATCFLIAESKTGGYLPGLAGVLMYLLMLIAAGGLATGAAGRWLYARLTPSPVRPAPAAAWDLWLIGAVSALAVLLSAME